MQDMRRKQSDAIRYTSKDRDRIADEVKQFLKDGGKIKKLPSSLSSKHTGSDVLRIHRASRIEKLTSGL